MLMAANIFCSTELPYLKKEKKSALFSDWSKYYYSLAIVGEMEEFSFWKKQLPFNSTNTINIIHWYFHFF